MVLPQPVKVVPSRRLRAVRGPGDLENAAQVNQKVAAADRMARKVWGRRLAATENRKQGRKAWPRPWVGRRQQVVHGQMHWRGRGFRPYRSSRQEHGVNVHTRRHEWSRQEFLIRLPRWPATWPRRRCGFRKRVRARFWPALRRASPRAGDLLFHPITNRGNRLGGKRRSQARRAASESHEHGQEKIPHSQRRRQVRAASKSSRMLRAPTGITA